MADRLAPQGHAPQARAGRRKDPAKRDAIIAAANELFAAQRYDAVTMEAVAARAGVSKMTVYSHFADKESLFEAIVRGISGRMLALPVQGDPGCGLAVRLTGIGIALLQVMVGCDAPSQLPTLAATLRSNQALAHRFYEAGPGRVCEALRIILSDAAAAGQLAVDRPERAVDDLIGLWEGTLPARFSFGLVETISAEDIEQRVRRGTALFLRLYAPPGGADAP